MQHIEALSFDLTRDATFMVSGISTSLLGMLALA